MTKKETNMTGEIPNDVIKAVKHIVTWAHGCEDEVDDIISNDVPVLEAWLVKLGLMPLIKD
jgi:hypothetical protein